MKKAIKNYLSKLQENEKKGFSLVELIIVMAIMAILVGIVASQVLPYMEKSRQSKDQQILSNICTDMVSSIAQATSAVGTINSTVDAFSAGTGLSGAEKSASDVFNSLRGDKSTVSAQLGLKSSKAKSKSVEVNYNPSTGKVTVNVNGCGSDTKLWVQSD